MEMVKERCRLRHRKGVVKEDETNSNSCEFSIFTNSISSFRVHDDFSIFEKSVCRDHGDLLLIDENSAVEEHILETFQDPDIEAQIGSKRALLANGCPEIEVDIDEKLFLCKACHQAYETLRACRKHVAKTGHSFSALKASRISANGCWSQESGDTASYLDSDDVFETTISNWFRVLEELKRLQMKMRTEETYSQPLKICEVNQGNSETDTTQTIPKAVNGEDNVLEKLSVAFKSQNGNHNLPIDTMDDMKEPLLPSTESEIVDGDISFTETGEAESKDNTAVDNDEELIVVTIPQKEPSCSVNTSKIYFDFQTNMFYCSSCEAKFNSKEEVGTHFTDNISDSPRSQNTDVQLQPETMKLSEAVNDERQSSPAVEEVSKDGDSASEVVEDDDRKSSEPNDDSNTNTLPVKENSEENKGSATYPEIPFYLPDSPIDTDKTANFQDSTDEKKRKWEKSVLDAETKHLNNLEKGPKKRKLWRKVKFFVISAIVVIFG